MPREARISSASGVVGLFAPSATRPAEIRGAFSRRDLARRRRRSENIARHRQKFRRIDRHAAGESFHRAGVGDVVFQGGHLQAVFVINRAVQIAHADQPHAVLGQRLGRHGTDVSEALHDGRGAFDLAAQPPQRLDHACRHAAAGGLAAAGDAAQESPVCRSRNSLASWLAPRRSSRCP